MSQLHECPARQCVRLVGLQGSYCCGPCAVAWEEPAGRYDPEHSLQCDIRASQRAGKRAGDWE